MAIDHHALPFDDGTLIKLDIYRRYLFEWMPVFLSSPIIKEINIFDFFCGPGKDKNSVSGSPLIALDTAQQYLQHAIDNNKIINLYFFDQEMRKIEQLENHLSQLNPNSSYINIHTQVIDFSKALDEFQGVINKYPSLLFMDQTGIKQITESVLEKLIKFKRTDLLFYVASSYAKRFASTPEFRRYLSIDEGQVRDIPQSKIHRFMCDYYQSVADRVIAESFFCPFSIKKGANVYGLIFGSKNLLGLQKFLDVAWKIDPLTGDSNFDIDDDNLGTGQKSLFEEFDRPKKESAFSDELEKLILAGELKTDGEVTKFAWKSGFLGRHAKVVLKRLLKDRRIEMKSGEQPRCSKEALVYAREITVK